MASTENMTVLVYVNGAVQAPLFHYERVGNSIVFSQAPSSDSTIEIVTRETRNQYKGDGHTNVFETPHTPKLMFLQFAEEVWQHRENPAVKDALEKLKIVVELVR